MNIHEAQRALYHQQTEAPSCETILADGTIVTTKGYSACNEGSYEFVTDLFSRPPLKPTDVTGSWGALSVIRGGFFMKPDALTLAVARSTYQDKYSEPVGQLLDQITHQLGEEESNNSFRWTRPNEPILRLDDIDIVTGGYEDTWNMMSSVHQNGTTPNSETEQSIPDIVEYTDWKHQDRPSDGAFIGHVDITRPDEQIPYRFLTVAYISPEYYSRQPNMRFDDNVDGFLLMIADQ